MPTYNLYLEEGVGLREGETVQDGPDLLRIHLGSASFQGVSPEAFVAIARRYGTDIPTQIYIKEGTEYKLLQVSETAAPSTLIQLRRRPDSEMVPEQSERLALAAIVSLVVILILLGRRHFH